MYKLLIIYTLINFLTNSYVKCLDEKFFLLNTDDSKLTLNTEKTSYVSGEDVKLILDVKKINKDYNLTISCLDEKKCLSVFKCSENCGFFEIKENITKKYEFKLKTYSSGHVILHLTKENKDELDLTKIFVHISVGHNNVLNILSLICGWIYFFVWSISFYPQIILNIKRKSVIGLNFDFIALNVTGFFFYSIYNISLYFVKSVQNEYFKANSFSLIPVEFNDVVFAVHAFIVSIVTLIQCFCIYERENQTISKTSLGLLTVFWSIAIISTFVLTMGYLNVLIYLNLLSYIKLTISFIKYIPQAYFNYKRKSTVGWSIENILLDLTGGFFSILQIILINFNYDDWGNIKGNITKFGLGLLSMLFDFIFITQHYIFYKEREQLVRRNENEDLGVHNQALNE